jgi:signal transduction histidine kinase
MALPIGPSLPGFGDIWRGCSVPIISNIAEFGPVAGRKVIAALLRNLVSIKAKFLASFGILLMLICGLGAFSFYEFQLMTGLDQVSNSAVLSGVNIGRLDSDLSDIRIGESEQMLTTSVVLKAEADQAIENSARQIILDLKNLLNSADTDDEKRILASLKENVPAFLRLNDEFLVLSHAHNVIEAKALFMGKLDETFDDIAGRLDHYIAINDAQAKEAGIRSATTQTRATYIIVAAIILAIVLAIGVFAALVRIIVSPLLSMTRALRDLAEGNLDTDVPAIGRRDEIGQLAHAMVCFKASAIALRTAKDEAQSGTRAKSEFLANMSHELRTPLNAVIGFSEMIKVEMFGPVSERYRGYATDIFNSGSHLLKVINEILDLSKLEAGQFELSEEEVDLTGIVEACVHLVEAQAQKSRIRLSTELDPEVRLIRADDRRMRQILINLLSNAVKFTPEGGQVRVSSFLKNGELAIEVSDTGIGIAAEDIPKAFALFSQVDSNISRQYEGTGLGLSLVKHFVELHGGTLSLESEVAAGTTVTVVLPADRIILRKPQFIMANALA